MKIAKDRFSILIENTPDGYAYYQIVKDSFGKTVDIIFIDVNPTFETISGLKRIDILGKSFAEVMPGIKESGFDWIYVYEQLAYTEKPIRFESYSEPLNRWYDISAFSPEEGYFATVFRDITEKKRAAEILFVSETRYRRLFESAKDGILILNAESGKIIDANPYLLERVGLSKELILGKPIWEIGKFTDIVASHEKFLELQKKEYIRYEDLPLRTVDGEEVAVEFISNIYIEAHFKVIQCNIRDITERRKMEKALLESEKKLTSILNNITDVIWCLSLPDMDLSYLSPSVKKIYGRSAEEFIKNPSLWQEAVHPDDQYLTEQAFKQIHEKGSAEIEYRIVRPDGNITWVYDKAQLFYDENHMPVRIEGISSDITDRKLAEESLQNRLDELEAIYKISATLRTAETQEEMLKLLLAETLKVINTEAGAICINNHSDEQLRFTATHGWFNELDDTFLKTEDNLFGKELSTDKTQLSRECAKDFRRKYPELVPEGWGIVCLPLIVDTDVIGTLFVSLQLPREITSAELKLLTSLTEMAGTAIQRIGLNETNIELINNLANTNYKLIRAHDDTIKGWAYAMDLKDKETENHCERVTNFTVRLARKMGMNQEELVHVRRGALLHDIGKMGVSDSILLKPGKLSEAEWEIMHQHPNYAFKMLSAIEYLRPALDIPYSHHEKWDGTGYPRGLKGEDIPLAARIFAVVDVFDALTNDRPYRKAWSKKKALEHIRAESNRQFDPQTVKMFLREVKQYEAC